MIPEIPHDWLATVAARATTPDERRAGAAEPVDSAESARIGAERLAAWKKQVARDDEKLFQRRLAWDGWTAGEALRWLGEMRPPAAVGPLPPWTESLREALETGFADDGWKWIDDPSKRPACYEPGAPLAFEEVFVPFIAVARRRTQAQAGPAAATLLGPAAWTALERHLLAFLTRRAERALFLEFSIEREAARFVEQLNGRPVAPAGEAGRTRYAAFVRRLYAEKRLLEFLGEYCVLARHLGTLMQFWSEAVAEFLGQLQADRELLCARFFAGRDPGAVTRLSPFLSDRHFHGRGVMVLQFASGDRIVYKPKGLAAEEAYYRFLDWCNRHEPPLPFQLLQAVDRGTHGWVEFVDGRPCADEAAVRRYYSRAGMFLALAYALEATDCHYENIIACGEHPMLVDLETLMHGRPRPDAGQIEGAHELANRQMQDSVLRTAFLPRWDFGPNGESYDISGLAGGGGMTTPFQVSTWREVNTDAMAMTSEPLKTQGDGNAPLLDGRRVDYTAYIPELLGGFTALYRWLLARRGELLAGGGPLEQAGFQRQRLRFLLRHTKVYFSLLKNSAHPNHLRDGADAAIHFDILTRAFLGEERPPAAWPVIARETADLMALDVPYFSTLADARGLHADGGDAVVPDFLIEPGFAAMRRRLESLGEDDLDRQLLYIKSALHAREALSHRLAAHAGRDEVPAPESVPPLTPGQCLEIAAGIGRELARRAIRAETNRSATWVSFEFMEQAGRYELLPMGYRLYEGITGPALFLSALAAETGDDDFRCLAEASLFSLREGLRNAPAKITAEIGLGAGMGVGSILYALTRIAAYVDLPGLRADAQLAAAQINGETIARDRRHDVLFGSAGALLALLAAPGLEPEAIWRGRLIACGEHLLRQRVPTKGGHQAWPTGDGGAVLTGFSHGAAGIAYALARAAAATGREDFLAAAREAVAYEDTQFVAERGNWLDLREVADASAMPLCSWCHGAPGILLGRAAGLPWLDGVEIRTDLERGSQAVRNHRVEFLDQLCCGNLGRAEILTEAGRLAGRPEWEEEGRQLSARVAARAHAVGEFGVNWRGGPFHAGFYQGVAGIGYHYLRLAKPGRHPSALYWQ